ncbi:hypothetical protein BH11ACT2_BH11ACT2_17940 [soil metagenome]
MTTGIPEERTLDVLVRRVRREPLLSQSQSRRTVPHRASLGTAFIGIGASLVVGIRAIYGFVWFLGHWHDYSDPLPGLIAWIALITLLAATFITARLVGDTMPDWVFAIFLLVLAGVIVLDLYSVWPLHDIGSFATSSLAAVMALLVVLTLRRTIELVVAAILAGVGLAVAIVVNTPLGPDTIAPGLTALATAVLPVVIGVVIVSGFRRMVPIELDRALVQSTVSAPRFAVGMLASEELARLDLAAEDLLDSVASGRIPLPLKPRTASVAASLATELRLHLIEGRRETWLYHAVTESELLGRSVTLDDKGSLAGLLDANQRDGLLGAIWLLISDTAKPSGSRTVQVVIGPIIPQANPAFGKLIRVPIAITTTGVARNRIDPSTWDAVRKVGRYSDSTQNASLRVDIECFVANPAEL